MRIFGVILLAALCPSVWAADGQQLSASLGTCKTGGGEVILDCSIGYRTFGTLNAERSNAILFPTYFTGTSEALQGNVGKGKLLDPEKYFVILVDALGDGISSSPSNSKQQHGLKFPKFSIHDMVVAEHRLVNDVLKIKKLHAVMGISMGGMQTFDWVVSYPEAVDRAIPIVGSPQLASIDLLLWTMQMHAIENDPAWKGGSYEGHPVLKTVVDIHTFALTTPEGRSKEVRPQGFESWLAKTEQAVVFDWNNWYRQLQAMLTQDLARDHNTTLEVLAAKTKPKLLAVIATQDHMVNPLSAIAFARAAKAQTVMLEGNCGHLAPGCEAAKWQPVVQEFLAR